VIISLHQRSSGYYYRDDDWIDWIVPMLLTVGTVPLPTLLFFQLRSLAKRAHSAHLAEHCAIVGIGTSLSLLYAAAMMILFDNAEAWGFRSNWTTSSNASLVLIMIISVAAFLFSFWSLYLLIRFAITFRRAARELRRKWTRDDLSREIIHP